MKTSKFNLVIEENGGFVLFNTLSGHCFKISKEVAEKIDKNKIEELEKETYDSFVKKGVIIENNIDENRYFSYFQGKTKYDTNSVSSTILLTWACNFACVYCYEGAGALTETMSMTTADSFVNFMINQAKVRNAKSMYINLFGGEPLMNIECGIHILEKLKLYCKQNDMSFASGIISNGTLLTPEILEELIKNNCTQIQITLDGMEEMHNSRRFYKNGQGTFSRILEVLEMLNKRSDEIRTVIRINVDKNNLDEVKKLVRFLGQKGKKLTNCAVDFGIVRGSTKACSAYSGNCFLEESVGTVLDVLWSEAEKEGFKVYTNPSPKWIFCGLYADNQYTITPNGDLYKCWEHAGDEHHLMGKLYAEGNIDDIRYAYYDWMSFNPLENEECVNCVYLPACGGGCAVVGYNETGTYHGKGCFKVKGVIEKQIMRYVKETIKNR